ncbi:MAG: AAA family ATPase [Caldilineaceae bacterium]|nr:AAA family ATPase [Caldilineaceae bacterium]
MNTHVKFRFEKFGPIDEAELELGNLTVIAGRNNTGKTYLVYALYGFFKEFRRLMVRTIDSPHLDGHIRRATSSSSKDVASKLTTEGSLDWKYERKEVNRLQSRLLKEMCSQYSSYGVPRVFNTSSNYFEKASMELDFNTELNVDQPIGFTLRGGTLSCSFDGSKFVLSMEKESPDEEFEVDPDLIDRGIKLIFIHTLFGDLFSIGAWIHVLSSARLSISLFYKELDYARSRLVRSLQEVEDDQKGELQPLNELISRSSRYPLPIQDNIDSTRDIPEVVSEGLNEELLDAYADLTDMIGGSLEVEDDDIRFVSRKDDSRPFDIPLHLASSSVGEMTNLYFYLGFTPPGEENFLIIDEPESHLDTSNQIQFARLLARLVNLGIRVLITTHSDYLIKELNNLIMLNSDFEDKENVMTRLGYRESLDAELVRAYVAEDNSLTPCKIDHFGIEMPVFDKTIDEINKVSNELASRLVIELEED